MNIPQKFTFFNGNSLLKLTNIQGSYYCTLPHIEADTLSSAVYDRMNVEHKLHTGKWKIVADLSEPEMKFPFTFRPVSGNQYLYTATKEDGMIRVNWDEDDDGEGVQLKMSEGMRLIKQGNWIVQSVGEQEPKEEIVEPVPEYGEQTSEEYREAIKKGSGITNEKIKVGSLSKLTLSVTSEGIDETTAKMQKLAEATENAAIAFESLKSIMDQLFPMQSVEQVCVEPINFNFEDF